MPMELFNFGGYGVFIWSAFIFTFINCFALYLFINKELSKKEKLFLSEFKETVSEKIKATQPKRQINAVLSGS